MSLEEKKVKKNAWHIMETYDKITIYLKGDEGDETIEIDKSDKDYEKKIKDLAKMKEFELLRKHYKIHHKKDIIEERGEEI